LAVIHSDAPPVHKPSRRNLGFGVGSVLLLAGTVWLIYFDYHREWKQYQREFRRLEAERTMTDLEAVGQELDSDQQLAALEQKMLAARDEIAAREGDVEAAREAVRQAEDGFYVAEEHWKVEKSYYDAQKYEFEEARRHIEESSADEQHKAEEVARAKEVFDEYEQRYQESVLALEKARTARGEANEALKRLTGALDEANKGIARMLEKENALKRKLEANSETLTDTIRNAPVLDLASPTLKIEQVILPHLRADINFMTIERVDRCVTCHKGIMDPAYADADQPFRTHPNLDLYLADASPHPYNKTGCTVCHQGLDRATSFISAMHTPRDEEQAAEWHSRYGWEEPHYWDFPQLPAQHAEAACRTCHLHEVRLDGADRYNHGLDIIERAGCYGCHKIAGYEARRKSGPTLLHVASKLDRDWVYRWIEDPRAYRPNTWMPRFFHLSNTDSPEDRARSMVEIEAIVSYLFDKSGPYQPAASEAPPGDADRGRALVAEKGCTGCHRIGESPSTRGTYGRDFGPALDRVSDKLSAAWVYDWIRNPKRYFPRTWMPDLRLTDGEAADITAYLMTLGGAGTPPPPAIDSGLLDDVVLEYLKAKLTNDQAAERLAGMSAGEKKVYLGERLIARYGCFGCHDIAGFEQALPIGVELSEEGSKLITRLDFGFVEIPHTKPDWFLQKLKDPRIFDTGKVKLPQEKLKMPDFGFTDEEAETLVTMILSMQKDIQPLDSHRMLDARAEAVEKGRRIVQDQNCRGCHIIEEQGGAIRDVIADQAYYPPNLRREGEKVQSDWLFHFLKGPSPIRPWLKVRMPTFGFDDEDATAVVKYFAAADSAPYPFLSPPPGIDDPDLLRLGRETFQQFKCLSCHTVGNIPPGVSVADLAPDLTLANERLRHDWILKWLEDPQSLLPGTRMPGFFYSDGTPLYPDADQKMKSVADYVLQLGAPKSTGSGAASP